MKIQALCVFALLVLAASPCAAQKEEPQRLPGPPRGAAFIFRFSTPAEGKVVCQAHERQCQMGQFIVWCCRAEQQCDTGYVGGCK